MTCLFFDYFYPAVKAGGPIKSGMGLVNLLSSIDNNYVVVTRGVDIDGSDLKKDNFHDHAVYLNNYSFKYVINIIKKSDKIILNSIFSLKFSIIPFFIALVYRRKLYLFARGELYPSALDTGKSFMKSRYLCVLKLFSSKIILIATNDEELKIVRNLGYRAVLVPNVRMDLMNLLNTKRFALSSKYDFGILGRFNIVKNQLGLINAYHEIGLKARVIMKGPNEDTAYSEKCLNAISSSDITIDFNAGDVDDFYRSIRFLLVPSLSENFAHVIFEAAARGIPVISNKNVPKWVDSQIRIDLNEIEDVRRLHEIQNMNTSEYYVLSEKIKNEVHALLQENRNMNVEFLKSL